MTSEDQDILAKISQLAGQINRHKNSQSVGPQTQHPPSVRAGNRGDFSQASSAWRLSRGAYSSRGYTRGGRPQVHRNRTLVLNGNNKPSVTDGAQEDNNTNTTSTQGWVTKTDRHLQLINTSIFEKESQNRAKAMEETRKLKLKQRDEREKLKFSKHLHRMDGSASLGRGPSRSSDMAGNYEINVNGIRFRVANNGSKLVKVPGESSPTRNSLHLHTNYIGSPFPGDFNAAKATPKTALVGGVKFHRSKNGNMFRAGIVKAYRYGRPSHHSGNGGIPPNRTDPFYVRSSGTIKKIDEPCRAFATTGSCSKGPRCRYNHDPSKVAVCREYLLKGACPSGEACDLSHDLTPQRTPFCLHFARGNCSNPTCPYSHVRVSPAAPVCRAFGIYGYCEKGLTCEDRHVFECPDFSNTGTCNTKGCKLPHRLKASVMRTHTAPVEDENSDLSSDDEDEDEIDSDDVDSDDLDEEFFGDEDGKTDTDIPMQQDFVHL